MLDLEAIQSRLAGRNLKEVSRGSGVPYNVVYRVANGTTRPSYATVKALSDYLEGEK